jgi:LDH2 family malate/lactate/ureidoglycolate dehydrogenase
VIPAAALRDWVERTLTAANAPPSIAATVAASLVESELRGYPTHGVLRLPGYITAIRDGAIIPDARPEVISTGRLGTVVVDGADGFGQVTAAFAVDELTRRTSELGVAVALTRRCRHVGRVGEYVERLAERGLVGFAMVSAEPLVSAGPGTSRAVGTNPHAWAVPSGADAPPILVDFATSAVSAGRVLAAAARGDRLAEGWLVDQTGAPSADPAALLAGGSLLPFGGHKGFALGVIADVVAGILSGTGSGSSPGASGAHGLSLMAIDVTAFMPLDDFRAQVEELRSRIGSSALGDGEPPVLPGTRSAARREAAAQGGIAVPEATAQTLRDLAASLGIAGMEPF